MQITEERKEHNDEYFYLHEKNVYSIQSLLASLGVQQGDTIYSDSANDVVRWPFRFFRAGVLKLLLLTV